MDGTHHRKLGWLERTAGVFVFCSLACAADLPETDTGVPFDPSAGDDGGGSCGSPANDDMEIGLLVELPGSVARLIEHGDGLIACGDGFAAWLGNDGSVRGQVDLDSTCVDAASVDDQTAVVLTRTGTLQALGTSGALSAGASATISGTPSGVTATGALVLVAAGAAGVLRFDADTLESSGAIDIPGAVGVATADAGVLVAAGGQGVGLLDASSGEVLAMLATQSDALGVRADGGEAIVLRGAQGWDWLDVADGLSLSTTVGTEGVVVDAMLEGGHAFIVEGHTVVRYSREDGQATRVSSEHRVDAGKLDGAWLRALSQVGDGFAIASDDGVSEFTVRAPSSAPELAVDTPFLQVFGEAGDPVEALFVLRNVGTANLRLGEVTAEGPFEAALDTDNLESSSCSGQSVLPPGASTPVSIFFDPGEGGQAAGTLVVESNDPNQPTLEIPIEGNATGLSVGMQAPDFTGLTLEGDPFRLSDHAGKVVFIKMFDFGCSTCSEEFPLIEQDLVPAFGDDVVFVGVHKGHRTAYAGALAADAQLSFPVVLDIDSLAFAQYRVPGKVFPLHIVIDADGSVVLADTEPGLTAVESALSSLVGP